MRSGGPGTGGDACERSPPGGEPGAAERGLGVPRGGSSTPKREGARGVFQTGRFGDLFGHNLALVRDLETQIFFPFFVGGTFCFKLWQNIHNKVYHFNHF